MVVYLCKVSELVSTMRHRLSVCYLLMQPSTPSPESTESTNHGEATPTTLPKDAPYFFDLDIEYHAIRDVELVVQDVTVRIQTQSFNDEVRVAECLYALDLTLDDDILARKQAIHHALRQDFKVALNTSDSLLEEYTILLISDVEGSPDELVETYQAVLAETLRSTTLPLKGEQMDQILKSRTRYGSDDLIIVDWEGAAVISKSADFRTEIELLKIGNYQLLKYRMIDRQIDLQLQQIRAVIQGPIRWVSGPRERLRKVVDSRLQLLLDFEATDQSLLLIGDWYTSQLYRIISIEFYMDEWKRIVRNKLDNLTSITDVVSQRLTFSWSRLLDIVQIVGWLFLLIGYIFIFLRDIKIIR